MHLSGIEILTGVLGSLAPVWLSLALLLGALLRWRARLGALGNLFDSPIGVIGLTIVLFWFLTAVLADVAAVFDPLEQYAASRRAAPGVVEPQSGLPFYFGTDNLGRDLFSRMIYGSRFTLTIAPSATLIALTIGVMLGLPAGYFGGRIDAFLSFIANLILAFPVILLFYLLVTPGIRETDIPVYFAAVMFLFPPLLCLLSCWSRYGRRRRLFALQAGGIALVGGSFYDSVTFGFLPWSTRIFEANDLNIFVAVIFVSAPAIFRIVRGLTLDIKLRDYVAAAKTRGESSWCIMLWEILPNARGPLIVDFSLRVGYTAIFLGTLGFFGLGLSPESPDWGSMINQTRPFIRILPTMTMPPTIALASLVLGLTLLADGLRNAALRN